MLSDTLSQRRSSGCGRKREAGREEGGRKRGREERMRKKNGVEFIQGKESSFRLVTKE